MISLTVLLCCCSYVGGAGGGASAGDSKEVKGREGVASEKEGGGVLKRRLAQSLVVTFSAAIGLTRVLTSSHFIHQVTSSL